MRWRSYFLFTGFLCFAGVRGFAQAGFEAVDMQRVEQQVNDASLGSFYPQLLDRFNAFDTTLTLADYRNLYYGFVFQSGYSAYPDQQRKQMSLAMQTDRYAEVMQLADSVLAIVPVSLAAHYYKAYAMMNGHSQDSSYSRYVDRYKRLSNAILSSGNGQHCNTAFKIIFVEDEYEVMFHHFEIDVDPAHAADDACDHFIVTPSGTYPQPDIFFDTSPRKLATASSPAPVK